MKRYYLCLFIVVATTVVAVGAQIDGTVTLKGNEESYKIKVGYIGKPSNGEKIFNMCGSPLSKNDSSRSISGTTFQPRISTLSWRPGEGCTYSHVELPLGWYLVYAQWGKRYLDWKWVEITDSKQKLRIDFTIDPSQTGSLDVTFPKPTDRGVTISLIPADSEGKVPVVDLEVASSLGTEQYTRELDKIGFEGIRAGRYLLKYRCGRTLEEKAIEVKLEKKTTVAFQPTSIAPK